MNLSPLAVQKFFANNGRPLVGGLLFTYVAGTDTKIDTYTDASGGTPNTNPIVLDFRGECRLWIDPQQAYKFVLSPAGDTDPPTRPIWTVDHITAAPQAFDNAAVDSGSVNNISLSIPQISSPVAFTRIVFQVAHTNTGATTISINGGTARPVITQAGNALTGGELTISGIYEAVFNGGSWVLQWQQKYPRTIEEAAKSLIPANYGYETDDSRRQASIYDLADLGPMVAYDDEEIARPYVDDDSLIDMTGDLTGRGTFVVAPSNYTIGFNPGDVAGYYFYRLDGQGRIAWGMKFNGNNQGHYGAYNPAIVNVNFYPILFGTGSTGQKIIASDIVDAAGHAIEGATTTNAIIALNTGSRQNGVGITSLQTGFVQMGNAFRDGSDSHYFVSSVRGASHVGNIGILTNNGGGVDLAGCRETAAVGNSYSDNLAQGIWVLRSPSPGGTGQTYRNVLSVGNVLRNNRNYADLDKAEIATGSHNELGTAQGENAAYIGNLIDVRLSVSSTNNFAFWNHPIADKTFHVANVTVGDTNTSTSPTAVDEGSPRSHYAFNVACPDSSGGFSQRATLFYTAAPSSRSVYAYNINWRIHPSSVGIPTEMESGDGFWQYHIVRPLPQAGIRLVEILYQGGFTHDLIEVTVASRNDSGLIKRTFVVRGQTGATPTILDNSLDKSYGNAIPTLTIAATTGKVTISSAGNVGVANNQSTVFFIKVTSPEDYPERFVPVFAT